MNDIKTRNISTRLQVVVCLTTVFLVSAGCFLAGSVFDYKIISLILLMVVSLLAMLFSIIPVLLAAALSALIWNFFFIPPRFTFHINNTADLLLFIMYFVVASINAVLTYNIRAAEKKAREKEEREHELALYNTLFNSLSHEMKTPLATILGAIDTIRDETLSGKNRQELLNQAESAALRLNEQVKNLLNMSRVESGLLQLKYEWCDVNELINMVVEKFDIGNWPSRITYEANDQIPICKMDGELIAQALQNIVHNAMQYTPENCSIKIMAAMENDLLRISVADTGLGVPEDSMEKLFSKFYRLPNAKTGGTGLGLSIAKGFIEAHKGRIMAGSNKPSGLVISMMIPVETTYINSLKNE